MSGLAKPGPMPVLAGDEEKIAKDFNENVPSDDFLKRCEKIYEGMEEVEEEPLEIERKFLVKIRNISEVYKGDKMKIMQIYLRDSGNGFVRRIRRECSEDVCRYTYTEKRDISEATRAEKEQEISEERFREFLKEADLNLAIITKERYRISYEGHIFEVDIYPQWSDKAIMEVELTDENESFAIPDFVQVIKEVTGKPEFSNYGLAEAFK